MKHLFAGLILLSCLNSFASSGKTPPPSAGPGSVQCAWYDSGKKEEHGPHISQQECSAAGHGSCQERCFTYEQECTAEGVRLEVTAGPNNTTSTKELKTTFEARSQDMWRSQEMVMNRCYQAYPRQDSCRITGCHEVANRIR